MGLPKFLYDSYKNISRCELVSSGIVTDESLTKFQTLLNNAQPPDDDVYNQSNKMFIQSLYYSSQEKFMKYITDPESRVLALILWTENKNIVRHFRLQRKVHLKWNKDTKQYLATKYVFDYSKNNHVRANNRKKIIPITVSDVIKEIEELANMTEETKAENIDKTSVEEPREPSAEENITGKSWADII